MRRVTAHSHYLLVHIVHHDAHITHRCLHLCLHMLKLKELHILLSAAAHLLSSSFFPPSAFASFSCESLQSRRCAARAGAASWRVSTPTTTGWGTTPCPGTAPASSGRKTPRLRPSPSTSASSSTRRSTLGSISTRCECVKLHTQSLIHSKCINEVCCSLVAQLLKNVHSSALFGGKTHETALLEAKTCAKVPSWKPKHVLKCSWKPKRVLKCPLGWQKCAKVPSWKPKRVLKCSWKPKRMLKCHLQWRKTSCMLTWLAKTRWSALFEAKTSAKVPYWLAKTR